MIYKIVENIEISELTQEPTNRLKEGFIITKDIKHNAWWRQGFIPGPS